MHSIRLLAASLITLLGASPVACSRKEPAAAPDSGAARSEAAASTPVGADASGPVTAAKAAASKISTAKAPLDRAKAKAYADALQTGRKETVAKRWDAAIAAFDKALLALPKDARALSERGYAKLLAGRLEAARQDLREAEALTKDAKLLGQIHYNHGLVAEKLNRPEEAKGSFARSNALAPTKAAAAKLAGKSCPAIVEIGRANTVVVKDWLGMYDALRAAQPAHESSGRPATDAAAKDRLCSRVPQGRCTDLAGFSEESELTTWAFHPVMQIPEGFLVGRDALSSRFDLPCGGEEGLEVRDAGGLRVMRFENSTGMRFPVCEADGGELTDCGPDDIPVSSACGTGAAEVSVVIFDLAKNKLLATVRHPEEQGKKGPTVTVTGRTLEVKGGGCDVKSEL